MITSLHGTNLIITFVLELGALVALGYSGFQASESRFTDVALGLGAPLAAAVLWGLFAAPRAPVSVPLASFAVKVLVFGSATAALYAVGQRGIAVTFAVLVVINAVLVWWARRRGIRDPFTPKGR